MANAIEKYKYMVRSESSTFKPKYHSFSCSLAHQTDEVEDRDDRQGENRKGQRLLLDDDGLDIVGVAEEIGILVAVEEVFKASEFTRSGGHGRSRRCGV
jgi:hypothetical protein